MKLYKIERGIVVPARSKRTGRGVSMGTLTLQKLEVGESFVVRDAVEGLRVEKQMRDLKQRELAHKGKRVWAARRLKTGIRFWRIK